MMNTTMKVDITNFNPCPAGLAYYNSKISSEEAWNDCERGDWMLWIAEKLGIDNRTLIKAASLCANTVRHLMKDKHCTDAIDAALKYANGEISSDELNKCTNAVYYIPASDNANHAAYHASYFAAKTAEVAYYAANAAYYACEAAYHYAPYEAKIANQKQTANICREILTEEILKKLKIKN